MPRSGAETEDLYRRAVRRWGPRSRWQCVYCGRSAGLTVDHFVAERLGGTSQPHNLVPCCDRCNSSKRHRDAVEWMRLVGVPERHIAILQRVTSDPAWRKPPDLVVSRVELTYPSARG